MFTTENCFLNIHTTVTIVYKCLQSLQNIQIVLNGLLVHLSAVSLLALLLLLLGILQLGLGDFPARLGGCNRSSTGRIQKRLLEHPCSVLLSRCQITLPPRIKLVLAFPSKLLLPVAGDLAALGLDGLFAVGSCAGALPGAQSTVALIGHTHAPLPLSTVRSALLFSWFVCFTAFSSHHCQYQQCHGNQQSAQLL